MAITPLPNGSLGAPNTLTGDAQTGLAPPNDLTKEAQTGLAVPGVLTKEAQTDLAAPNDLTALAQTDLAAPNDLTTESQTAIAPPTALTPVAQAVMARPTPPITLGFDFANDKYQISGAPKTIAEAITFTRSTTSTYWGRDLDAFGNWVYSLKTAAINEPCLAYDPETSEPLGLQIFGAATNLLTYSEQFDNAAWGKFDATISANASTAPDGTLTADKLIEDSSNGIHIALQPITKPASQITYTYSAFVKSAERQVRLTVDDGVAGGASTGIFNPLTGIFDSQPVATVFTAVSQRAIGAGAGVWRISLTFTTNTEAALRVYPQLSLDGIESYQGDGTSGIYIWGAQLETGPIATPYIKTEASQVTRAADVATVDDLSGWYNQAQGSVFVDSICAGLEATGQFRRLASTNDVDYWISPSGTVLQYSGRGIAGGIGLPIDATQRLKTTLALTQSNVGITVNGAYGEEPAAKTVDASFLGIGVDGGFGNHLNGYIKTLNYYPTALNQTEMVDLTK